MPYLIDARCLLVAFDASHDPHVPSLVFALLDIFLKSGPFVFDAGALSRRLTGSLQIGHVPPETLIRLQPELERYFINAEGRWVPRPGVLAAE